MPIERESAVAGAEPAEGAFDIVALWNLLWRNRLLIGAFGLLGAAIAAAFALTATPMFRAEVTITDVRDPGLGSGSNITRQFGGLAALAGINLSGAGSEGVDSRAVLNSRRLAEQFVARPSVLKELNHGAQPVPSLWFTVKHFRESFLSISEDPRKGTTTVAVMAEKPENAARWANEYVALANEILRNRALADANRNIAYLNDQIAKTSSIEIQKVMYNLIENETKAAMLANARQEYAFMAVDPAVTPEVRYSPRRTLMVIVGGLLGGVLGVLIALGRNLWRRGSKNAE
jgi:LPS O-antigen subunit length determinant protein (WzzB/FepE family)